MNVALALDAASDIHAMIGLSLGWGPRKIELHLPANCDHDNLPLPRDESSRLLPELVEGFRACLGVPRHPTNCDSFISAALLPLANRHGALLDLVSDVSEEDPFFALRLLQVCGVTRFGHVLSTVPPDVASAFCGDRDTPIADALGVIQASRWTLPYRPTLYP